jgi:hypothetical protein
VSGEEVFGLVLSILVLGYLLYVLIREGASS